MPFVHVTWVPKACRTAAARKTVATAILKALTAPEVAKVADIPPQNLVVRFSEAVDGFALPQGHDIANCDVKVEIPSKDKDEKK